MFEKFLKILKFPIAQSDAERYDQLVLLESWNVFWRINWSRTKQYGFGMIKFWTLMSFIMLYNQPGGLAWPTLWQWYFWVVGAAGFFILAWPSVLLFFLLTYYLRLPFWFLNPLCWFAIHIYGYNFEDDLRFFRRVVIIQAQDGLLMENGIDANLRN